MSSRVGEVSCGRGNFRLRERDGVVRVVTNDVDFRLTRPERRLLRETAMKLRIEMRCPTVRLGRKKATGLTIVTFVVHKKTKLRHGQAPIDIVRSVLLGAFAPEGQAVAPSPVLAEAIA